MCELSHELRTPLAVIRIQAQMLKRLAERNADGDPAPRERYIAGLARIDEAVTALNAALQRRLDSPSLEGAECEPAVREVWHSPPGT
jgi:signal transduction histidine kinase